MEREIPVGMVDKPDSETGIAVFEVGDRACPMEFFESESHNNPCNNVELFEEAPCLPLTEGRRIHESTIVNSNLAQPNLASVVTVGTTSHPPSTNFLESNAVFDERVGPSNVESSSSIRYESLGVLQNISEINPVLLEEQHFETVKLPNICRVCANTSSKVIPLFHGEGHSLGLIDKIHRCLPIKVSTEDNLPHQICDDCVSKLQICNDLISISIAGNDKLLSMNYSWSKLEIPSKVLNFDVEDTEKEEGMYSGSLVQEGPAEFGEEPKQTEKDNKEGHSTQVDTFKSSQCPRENNERQWCCNQCDYKASRKSSLMLHKHHKHKVEEKKIKQDISSESFDKIDDSVLMCCYCDQSFLSENKWKKHIQSHTKSSMQNRKSIETCKICSDEFFSAKALQQHLKISHNLKEEPRYACDKCDKSYRVASSLDIHRATHSNETPYLCDTCGKSFKHASNLRSHKRSHLDGTLTHRHACDMCPKSFSSRFHLSEHKNVHLDVSPYSCEVCDKKFHRRIQLRQHKLVHNNDSSYECSQCGACFNRRGNMTQHMKRHQGDRKFICKVCKQSFHTLSEVVQHRRKHTTQELVEHSKEKGMHSCSLCQKSFSSSQLLEDHVKMHTDNKFQCEVCNKQLSNRRTLEYHIRSFHTGERPFPCQYCSESFLTRENRTVHERVHTGEKPYTCSICQMSFRCSSNLTQHAHTHRDERPWACDHCPKRFKRKGILRVHLRTHTGEKPFCCDICSRRFTQKNDMLKHQLTHKSDKQTFVCSNCNWAFHSRKELNKHLQTHHNDSVSRTTAIPVTNSVLPIPAHSQTLVISNEICDFPITILEEGSNIIVHQIQEMDKQIEVVEVDPCKPASQLVQFTDSLFQTVVSESQVLQLPSDGSQLVQFEDTTNVNVLSSTTEGLLM